jgi:diguanylate cyclase (GGDEF)-like protein
MNALRIRRDAGKGATQANERARRLVPAASRRQMVIGAHADNAPASLNAVRRGEIDAAAIAAAAAAGRRSRRLAIGAAGRHLRTALPAAIAAAAALLALGPAGQPLAAAWIASVSLAAAAGLGAGLFAARMSMRRPLADIAASLEMLAARDVFALVDEFASLEQGERPRQLEVHAAPVALPSDRDVRRVAEALNTTISRLQVGIHQFQSVSGEPCRRLFYVGPDDYLLGCTAAEAMGGMLPDGGQILLLTAHFRHAGLELRRRGFESMLRERFPTLHVVGMLQSRVRQEETNGAVKAFLRSHSRLAGIYCGEATGLAAAVASVTDTELAGRVVIVGHDLLDKTVAAIQAGVIAATVTQDPFGQGHDTPVHLFNAVAHGWRPPEPRIISDSDLVTRDNVRKHWRPYEGPIDSQPATGHRPRPLGPSSRPLRIAVLGLQDDPFWPVLHKGVLAAAEELAAFNATVVWIVPEGDNPFDVAVRGPAVDALVQDGYDAIATINYDSDLVPYLNRAVENGVLVATLNAESSSLQGLVARLSKERKRLELAATHLEAAASHDPLTGTLNRMAMDADLEEARASVAATGQARSVIMIDIDQFKAYNDTYGHAAGDVVLKIVAERVQAETRPMDRLYRYGGEEFLVLLHSAGLEEGEAVANRIACAIATLGLANVGNKPWGILTISAGVAAIDPACARAGDAVANADSAMYRSKRSGRNTVATYRPEPVELHLAGAGDVPDRP